MYLNNFHCLVGGYNDTELSDIQIGGSNIFKLVFILVILVVVGTVVYLIYNPQVISSEAPKTDAPASDYSYTNAPNNASTNAPVSNNSATNAPVSNSSTTDAPNDASTNAPVSNSSTINAPGARIFKPNSGNTYSKTGTIGQGYTTLGTFKVPSDYVEGSNATVTLSAGGDISTKGEVNFGIAKGPNPNQGKQIAFIFHFSDKVHGLISYKDSKFNDVVKSNVKLGKPGDTIYVGVNLSYPGQFMKDPKVKVVQIQY